jgi:hypothetical protein
LKMTLLSLSKNKNGPTKAPKNCYNTPKILKHRLELPTPSFTQFLILYRHFFMILCKVRTQLQMTMRRMRKRIPCMLLQLDENWKIGVGSSRRCLRIFGVL